MAEQFVKIRNGVAAPKGFHYMPNGKLMNDADHIAMYGYIEKTINTQYSFDTVSIFQESYPTVKFIWIMGSDNAAQIEEWKNWKEFIKKIPMAIYPRATNPIIDVEKKLKKNAKKIDMENSKDLINTETPCFTFINGPMNDISSTRIRREM